MHALNQLDPILAFVLPGGPEWIILLVLGLLIFGRRLPEVGRSLGRGIVEFKKGIKGIEDEIEDASAPPPPITSQARQQIPDAPTAPDPAVGQAAVGGEGPNPYAPAESAEKPQA